MAGGQTTAPRDFPPRGTAARFSARQRGMAARFAPLRAARLVAPALVALALAGCAAGEGLDGSFGSQDMGVAGGSALNTGGATGASPTSAGVVNSGNSGVLTVGSGANLETYDCPMLTVRTGAASWQVTDKPSGALRYQGTIGRLARECSIAGGTMMVKVGIEGRILLGEKGAPGQVKVPIRIAVVNEGPNPKTIATKFFAVAVDVPADPGHTAFTVVEDQISFPLLKPHEMERYVIYVGFDPQGTPEPRARPAPSAAAKPKPKPKPAAAPAATSAPAPAASSGAPSSDVFGPPPSSSSGGFSAPPSSGGFSAPPSTSTFSPPPK